MVRKITVARNNRVSIQGNITSDIYYDSVQRNGTHLAYLRVYLVVDGSREAPPVKGIRIVFYGSLAELAAAYLQKGSRIEVEGHIQLRSHEGALVFEIVGEDIDYILNVDTEAGERKYQEMLAQGRIRPRWNDHASETNPVRVGHAGNVEE